MSAITKMNAESLEWMFQFLFVLLGKTGNEREDAKYEHYREQLRGVFAKTAQWRDLHEQNRFSMLEYVDTNTVEEAFLEIRKIVVCDIPAENHSGRLTPQLRSRLKSIQKANTQSICRLNDFRRSLINSTDFKLLDKINEMKSSLVTANAVMDYIDIQIDNVNCYDTSYFNMVYKPMAYYFNQALDNPKHIEVLRILTEESLERDSKKFAGKIDITVALVCGIAAYIIYLW